MVGENFYALGFGGGLLRAALLIGSLQQVRMHDGVDAVGNEEHGISLAPEKAFAFNCEFPIGCLDAEGCCRVDGRVARFGIIETLGRFDQHFVLALGLISFEPGLDDEPNAVG